MTKPYGLIAPLHRGPVDFVAGSGAELFSSRLRHVLLTEPGELLWRTTFGAGLSRLRHQNNDVVLGEIARASVRRALAAWMPNAEVGSVETTSQDGVLVVGVSAKERTTQVLASTELVP